MILRALAVLAAPALAVAVTPGGSAGNSMDSIGSGASGSELGSPVLADASTTAVVTSEGPPDTVIGESLLLGQPAEEGLKIRNSRKGGGDEFRLETSGQRLLGHLDQGEVVSMDLQNLAAEQLGSPFSQTPEEPKSLEPVVGVRQQSSWLGWFFSCIVSLAIFALGIALCNGLSKKIEKEEQLESGQDMSYSGKAYVPGALVIVTKAFMSNGEPPVSLRQGQTGVIQKIDAVGDALIRFADHSASQWVYEQNYANLRVR